VVAQQVHSRIVGRFGANQDPPVAAGLAGQAGQGGDQLRKVPRTYLGRSATGGGAGGQAELASHPCHGGAL